MDDCFGQLADGLRKGVALGLSVSNEEAANEFAASKFKKPPVYGTARYYYGLDAVAYALRTSLGASVVSFYGRPYAMVDGRLIYPWCFGNAATVHHHDVPVKVVSQFRQDLFAARTASRDRAQMWIDFASQGEDGGPAIKGPTPEELLSTDPKAVLVAYASNPRAGLLKVILGDVELYPDGHMHWNHEEEIILENALAGDLSLTRNAIAESLQSFDSRPEPDVDLNLHEEDADAGENIKETYYEDPERPDDEEGNESSNAV
ncbi:hypothetical protein Ait01nite_019730 [Actinoplanes italicus]|uniref:Uncharacterized protein n=1 Tax=Actinoplanes italicus TaxID=113567 RepID=A0A2T0KPG1_9ACTN|nr:hypothetical protein [Actinoplanes italicus]PRX25626.1 hypothetical protein CLV67_101343 [Actinoplanes italicus]GIE28928.1 hypothetical protein Ait01nite_019730 [Actinoplanes italicus]